MVLSGGFLFLSSKLEWEWMERIRTVCSSALVKILTRISRCSGSTVMRANCGNLDAIR